MLQYQTEISQHNRALIVTGKICKYCFKETTFVNTVFGHVYYCKPCEAWVGVHNGTTQSLGSVANKELREWRIKAHAHFDLLWIKKMKVEKCSKTKARKAGYAWLAKKLNLEVNNTHISWFEVDMCKKVIDICKPYLK